MKTLVIVIHPDLKKSSTINKRWVEELSKYPNRYTVYDLYSCYPDEKIDVAQEQRLVESHDKIVFQFPFYWFNCPPLFKKWLDDVLTHGWAYGSHSGYKFNGKKIALAITAAAEESDYRATGVYKYTLKEFTIPFEITFDWIKADYKSFFAFYGADYLASEGKTERLEKSAQDYITFIESL
jgi:putative NADPH-quinone reductase